MSILDIIRKAAQRMLFPAETYNTFFSMPAGMGLQFGKRVNGYQSAIIMACVFWIMRTFPEAPLFLRQRNADGSKDDLFDHPMLTLLDAPNPFYDGLLLQMATIADYTIDGNAYWRKIRSEAGRVVQLWWIPSTLIEPRWNFNNLEYITHYDYAPGGFQEKVPPEDIVHFRNGLDPNNIRKGLAPLKSLFREIFTDDEAANMTAALLKNLGVPGIVISPKEGGTAFLPEVAKRIKERFKQETTGDRRGEPLVMSAATEVTQFGFNPKQMLLTELRRIPEERISGVLGVPAIVAGLGAGLARSTFANMHEAREMAYESNIIPSQRIFGSVIKRQLLTEFVDDLAGWLVAYDLSEVRVLQEDENKKAERVSKMVQGGYLTVANAQRETNTPVDETQNIYLRPLQLIEVPAGTKALQHSTEWKDGDLTEEVKTIIWKRVDRQRVAWWPKAEEQVKPLYEDEAAAVAKAVKGLTPSKMAAAAEKAINSLQPDWEKMLIQLNSSIVDDFGGDQAGNLGSTKADTDVELKWTWDPASVAITKWIATEATKDIVSILATNLDDVKRIIAAGIEGGQSSADIGLFLQSFYIDHSPFKATRVARTEVTKAANFGSHEAAKQSGVVKTKTWLSSRDDRVRDAHVTMDGETVKLNEQFSNGRMYPDEIMCRCVLTYNTR